MSRPEERISVLQGREDVNPGLPAWPALHAWHELINSPGWDDYRDGPDPTPQDDDGNYDPSDLELDAMDDQR